ncbi:2-isopropylmalate synthase [Sulfuriferula plumbiphila]|uniref:2-isopropylmalate synthase n=1 Tax=Sulfuriferula plumbiphila TaxID=171865 RepID=A0A512L5N6_9PROT|nr:2-isopropylmalate synthase [Sulfuriferula plumbiphila]BBP03439.1 2-isopropylmalate synthase [Sulfuriferula plumbiphila]GEP29790.1 2-isopropylmalate synthase [Sulfuriferula plumbiphila]
MQAFDHRKYHPTPAPQMRNRQWPNRTLTRAPRWCSVDLRDGNQALLEPMNVAQKQRLWTLLVKLGFKEIEVGFPAASQPDFDFVRWLIEAHAIPDDVTIQVLVQAREALIVRTFEALRGARRAIVHVYNSTSPVQRERVFGLDRDGVTAIARQGAAWVQREAQKYPATAWTFQYSPESFSNTEMDYAVEICEAVLDVWQPTPGQPCIINLPSTVESSTPNIFADQVEYFATHISRRDSIIISLHTHNDRGCAVAAAELGVLAGADRVEGTLLGNGERTGNMDIVTMAMNLYSQGIAPQLDLSNPDEIIQVATECTALPVHPRHPWVGELVYTAFSGSHQDAIRKCLQRQQAEEPWQVAYLPIDPQDLGRDYQAVIRVNSQSGKGGVAFVMERDYGLSLPRWMQVELAQAVQRASEADGGEVDSARIHALFMQTFVNDHTRVSLKGYRLDRNGGHDTLAAQIMVDGQTQLIQGHGEGAISAFVQGWMRHSGQHINVVDYSEHAIGSGTGAEAVAYIQLNLNGQRVAGAAFDHDTVSASLKAVLSALNRVSVGEAILPAALSPAAS